VQELKESKMMEMMVLQLREAVLEATRMKMNGSLMLESWLTLIMPVKNKKTDEKRRRSKSY
jgi:hypothetical protein